MLTINPTSFSFIIPIQKQSLNKPSIKGEIIDASSSSSSSSTLILKARSNNNNNRNEINEENHEKILNNLKKITNASSSIVTSIALACTIATTTLLYNPPIASAASPSSNNLDAEKDKIVKGYKRLDYLLTNWETLTTFCNRNDNPYNGCERSPEAVMEYLGFKSMNDPLFRADKTLIKLQRIVPDEYEGEFQDALDTWVEKAEEGNGMAFISSWGEANPGGGKDRVAMFLERSRKDVVESKDSLATVIKILDLQVK